MHVARLEILEERRTPRIPLIKESEIQRAPYIKKKKIENLGKTFGKTKIFLNLFHRCVKFEPILRKGK